jgi:manganese transport protein
MGIRLVEAFVLMLIATIAICFTFEIYLARPEVAEIARGFLPTLSNQTVYLAVAICGATVMPHNLYLHSALVQTRQIGESEVERRRACRFNLLDSALALNGALFVNAAILIMAAAVFFTRGVVVTQIEQAHQLLSPLMGTTLASVLFGAALLCSGQSSTLTGTMAGQIVMEGFLHFRIQPWLRRLITRSLAITPAILTIYFFGAKATTDLIVFSQVILNLQLPFAVIPLIHLTSDRRRMGAFANGVLVRIGAWACALLILVLNIWLAWGEFAGWHIGRSPFRVVIIGSVVLGLAAFAGFLAVIAFWPLIKPARAHERHVALTVEDRPAKIWTTRTYERILVPLDHSEADAEAIANALALARPHHATVILLHVEEGVTSRMYGAQTSTAEITEGQEYLAGLVASLEAQDIPVRVVVRYGKSPAAEIAATVEELQPDLVVMASHGHTGIKDLIFGTTINNVRHHIGVPLLIVRRAQ